MMNRKKVISKRLSEENKVPKEDSNQSSHPLSPFSFAKMRSFGSSDSSSFPFNINEKQKRNRRRSSEADGKETSAKSETKTRGPFKMKLHAKRAGFGTTPNGKGKNTEARTNGVIKQESPQERRSSSEKGSCTNLNDMKYPAEYVPPEIENLRRRSSAHRVSYRKAIQKAGYNMNEIATVTAGSTTPRTQQKPILTLTDVDWSEQAAPDHHIWAPSSVSGDVCFVGEKNCQKSGPRKKCDACHIVVHDSCFSQLPKINFHCKTTFRESGSRLSKEPFTTRHHWVHRRKQEGKCKRCSKSFEKMFGFRESTKVIAISCSICKEAYHNKVNCFHMDRLDEPCSLGVLAKSIVPPSWIVKNTKQKSWRNRSKKRKSTSNGLKRKPTSKEYKHKTFVIRPHVQQAAFLTPLLVYINPKSGGRQGHKLLQYFRWFLNPRQVFDLSKDNPQEAIELYRKVPNLRILACGGDGTVGWILSVLDKLNINNPPSVGIVPLGTGNDLSRTLNFGSGYTDEGVLKIIQGVEDAKMVKLDRWKLVAQKNENVGNLEEDENHNETNCEGTDKLPLDVLNNYFSIGSDAQVSFNFHESREAHPAKFTSRFGNKFFYARAGVYEYVSRQSKNLFKHVSVVCDDVDITPKIRDLKPVCLLFLNIPRYSSGTLPWGNPTHNEFHAQSHEDKLIEVLAFSINQLGMLFVGGHGERLCQCRSAVIRTTKTFPIQIDGEPCKLNPSIIKLNFFNQANMLLKCKRRPSVGLERQHSQEQFKIRINLIKSEIFDVYKGNKQKLSSEAIPLIATLVKSQSTLDTVRSCLILTLDDQEYASLDKWIFLDSTSRDKLYKIDRNQENRLFITDVTSSDREVYILDIPGLYAKHTDTDRHRNRIKSDSSLLQSISSSTSSQDKPDYTADKFKFVGVPEDSEADPTSSYLDVVFEQPESTSGPVTPSSFTDNTKNTSTTSIQSHDTNKQSLEPESLPHTVELPPIHQESNSAQVSSSEVSLIKNEESLSLKEISEDHVTKTDIKTSLPSKQSAEDRESSESQTPGCRSDVETVVKANGSVAKTNWQKVFLDSSKRGDCDKMKAAVIHGACLSARDEEGCTALHQAVRFSHESVVDYLLEQDLNMINDTCTERKQTALHKAAWYGHAAICKKLVSVGADMDVRDYKGLTPVDRAREAGDDELVDFFVKTEESRNKDASFHETDL